MAVTTSRPAAGKRRSAAPSGRTARRRGRIQWKGYLYALPALAVLTAFLLYPLVQLVQISLYHWDGLSASTWAGFANYAEIARDPQLRAGFVHSFVLILFFAIIPIVLALLLAAVTTRASRLRGVPVFRALIFLPQVIAMVVTATAWTAIYAPDGVLNTALRAIGLKAVTRPWLGDFSTALPSVGLIGTWLEIGLCLVLFLAGIGQIPAELYEAAKLDGANAFQRFRVVTLPAIQPVIFFLLITGVIGGFQAFDQMYLMTGGGPDGATMTYLLSLYNHAFRYFEMGTASAMSYILLVIILIVTWVGFKLVPQQFE